MSRASLGRENNIRKVNPYYRFFPRSFISATPTVFSLSHFLIFVFPLSPQPENEKICLDRTPVIKGD